MKSKRLVYGKKNLLHQWQLGVALLLIINIKYLNMKKLLYKLAETKTCIIAFIMPRFTPFREVAAKKSTDFLNEATKLSKQHTNYLAMYGNYYKNTLGHNTTELRIKWLEFKATFLIETFRLSNGA